MHVHKSEWEAEIKDGQTDRQKDRQTHTDSIRHRYIIIWIDADRLINRQTDGQNNGQTDRMTDRQTDRQKSKCKHNLQTNEKL